MGGGRSQTFQAEAVAEGEWEPREQMWGLERHQGQVINTPYLFCKRAQVSSVQLVPISELAFVSAAVLDFKGTQVKGMWESLVP